MTGFVVNDGPLDTLRGAEGSCPCQGCRCRSPTNETACSAETAAAIAGIEDLGQPVPVPKGVPWFPADIEAWSVRWVLLHIIEETARHAGHADIVRESVDGATGFELLAAAEGWPATPWLQPWTPPSATTP